VPGRGHRDRTKSQPIPGAPAWLTCVLQYLGKAAHLGTTLSSPLSHIGVAELCQSKGSAGQLGFLSSAACVHEAAMLALPVACVFWLVLRLSTM
jgi:hypothetical protein